MQNDNGNKKSELHMTDRNGHLTNCFDSRHCWRRSHFAILYNDSNVNCTAHSSEPPPINAIQRNNQIHVKIISSIAPTQTLELFAAFNWTFNQWSINIDLHNFLYLFQLLLLLLLFFFLECLANVASSLCTLRFNPLPDFFFFWFVLFDSYFVCMVFLFRLSKSILI